LKTLLAFDATTTTKISEPQKQSMKMRVGQKNTWPVKSDGTPSVSNQQLGVSEVKGSQRGPTCFESRENTSHFPLCLWRAQLPQRARQIQR